ncbi:MAG: response regulator [Planctomycetales bacterium]|nr:response regulator [Planctomycetales bacterium]
MSNEPFVFVIDDEPIVLASIVALLKASGFNVNAFASAEEFLDSFEPDQRGCLLLDARLPGMTGVELQRRLQSDGVDLPVILMSGHASHEVHKIGMSMGAVEFLEKPVDSRKLIELLRSSIENL